MKYYFHEIGTVPQVILLVLTLLTVIILTASGVLSFKHKLGIGKNLSAIAVLVINVTLYVMMQVEHRRVGTKIIFYLPSVMMCRFKSDRRHQYRTNASILRCWSFFYYF